MGQGPAVLVNSIKGDEPNKKAAADGSAAIFSAYVVSFLSLQALMVF